MAYDATKTDLDIDYETLEAIGRLHDTVSEGVIVSPTQQNTIRRWFAGHAELPDDPEEQACLMAMALDLELFTPASLSGKTRMDRFLGAFAPRTDLERMAARALRAAEFRLVRVVGCEGPDLVELTDLVTNETLMLLNAEISPLAAGAPTAMRLCPLESGRQVLISPLFLMDETMLASARTFARPGKPLGAGHRCAANLYRDAARRGFIPMPRRRTNIIDDIDGPELEDVSEVQRLAIRWMVSDIAGHVDELTAEIRRAAGLANLVDACGLFGRAVAAGQGEAMEAFRSIADIQMETLRQRARAGVDGYHDIVDRVGREIAGHIRADRMDAEAADLFQSLRVRWWLGEEPARAVAAGDRTELDKVIQRIMALRAKTVDQGCTEQEAMAAAAKVAELLDRHDLTLDEVAVRKSDCAGAPVDTGRRRRAPIDDCAQPVACFCDCRVWSEESHKGTLRYIFFGLKADVEAARLLHDLIDRAFETESARFRASEIYRTAEGGDRRAALHSFQIGLASGISRRLHDIKSARGAKTPKTTGFDLVTVKHSVIDEEMEKLGLRFVTKSASGHRRVRPEAYAAGKAAGAQFEPHGALTA